MGLGGKREAFTILDRTLTAIERSPELPRAIERPRALQKTPESPPELMRALQSS